MKYLLPCEKCGAKSVVDPSQAGQQIQCACGVALEVPSWRAIRQLERTADAAPARPRSTWNPARGAMFAGGLVVGILGLLIAAAAGFGWSQIRIPEISQEAVDKELARLDQSAPAEAWDLWVQMRDTGLGPYHLPPKYAAAAHARRLLWLVYGGVTVLVLGIASITSAFLWPQPLRR